MLCQKTAILETSKSRIDVSSLSFSNLPIHDLTQSHTSADVLPQTFTEWISHDGKARSQVPRILELCLNNETNILFGKFVDENLKLDLLKQLNKLHFGESGLVGFFTSGSTGKRKLVVHKMSNLVESACSLVESYPEVRGRVTYSAFPTSYMAGILNNFIVPLVANSPIVLDKEFDFSTRFRITQTFKDFDVEWAWMSPGMLQALTNQRNNHFKLEPLKLILSATGPLSDTSRIESSHLLEVPILNTYGLTEVLFVSGEKDMKSRVYLGQAFYGVRMILSKENLLEITTKTIPHSLYQLDGDTLRPISAFDNCNSFLTSDIAKYEDGELRLLGRIDDVVVLRGVNVSLSEIELATHGLKGVLASCARKVVTSHGEDIELLIELADDVKLSVIDIRRQLLKFLPPDCVPGRVSIVKLPRLDSGKVDRPKIRGSI